MEGHSEYDPQCVFSSVWAVCELPVSHVLLAGPDPGSQLQQHQHGQVQLSYCCCVYPSGLSVCHPVSCWWTIYSCGCSR